MSIWAWIKLLFSLPSLIPLILEIVSFIKNFKKDGFKGIGDIAQKILDLILGLIPTDRSMAIAESENLLDELEKCDEACKLGKIKTGSVPNGLKVMHDRLNLP